MTFFTYFRKHLNIQPGNIKKIESTNIKDHNQISFKKPS